ncbi:hypothetical protein ACFXTN_013569 [Malus domestica]
MPCKILGMKSPYQLLFHQEPMLHTLKIFGSAVYPFLRPYNQNKLQPRSKQCFFLGFAAGYTGVVCYDISSNKLVLSRHVIHDENTFPFKSPKQLSSVKSNNSQGPQLPLIIVQLSSFGTRADHTASLIHEDSYVNPVIVEDRSRDSL